MTTHSVTDLDVTSIPSSDIGERCRARQGQIDPRHPPRAPGLLLSRRMQPITGRLARLKGAFSAVRASIDPGWVAVALVVAVILGGFTWLFAEVRRIEAKVDAVSLRLAEMPGTLQGAVRAQTEDLKAMISAQRQSGIAAPPGPVASTRGGSPAPAHARTADALHINSNLRGVAGARSSAASLRSGTVANNATATTRIASSGAISGTARRP